MQASEKNFKSGFVTLIGRPNVGKSTLLNRFIGQKVTIMSDKAQTTRHRIQAVYTDNEAQIVFIDTPGIHKPKHQLGDFMLKTAFQSLQGVDLLLFVVNASEKIGPGDRLIIDRVKDLDIPIFLLINKIDLIDRDELFSIIESYTEEREFTEVFPVSATEGDNVQELMEKIKDYLPVGPQYYPADQVMDHPEYFLVSEFIREKILHLTREEIPHSVAVQVEKMNRNEDDKIEISAVIYVERSSQKGIIIGKSGSMIKKIGTLARKDIEQLLGDKVYLDLYVKVQKDWRNKIHSLVDLGYKEEDY